MSWSTLGIISATFTIDGVAFPQTYSVTTTTPGFVQNDGEAINFPLFTTNTIPTGDHTLIINVTRCENQTFILNYITYAPSFSSLSAMPNLLTTTTTAAAARSTSDFNPNQTTSTPKRKTKVGALIGEVIGALVVLALIVWACCYARRRRRSASAKSATSTNLASSTRQAQIVESSRPATSLDSRVVSPFQSVQSTYSPTGPKGERIVQTLEQSTETSVIEGEIHSGTQSAVSTTGPATQQSEYEPPAYDALSTRRRSNLD